jgi:SAM-dependent methyltransferase
MPGQIDIYDSAYGDFNQQVLAEVRRETYGEDIGQNSWTTAEEYDTFHRWLDLAPRAHVLEVASGSGGPALYLARSHDCRLTGIDISEEGVNAARQAALAAQVDADFRFANVDDHLPFEAQSFDAVMCIDAMNHFRDRLHVLKECHRVLKAGGRVLFTDPVVPTGPVSNEELAARSSVGFFLFVPPEVTERLITDAGFTLIRREDLTENTELTSGRWRAARQRHQADLLKFEGEEHFEAFQGFLSIVHQLAHERRLSRLAFVAEKRAA